MAAAHQPTLQEYRDGWQFVCGLTEVARDPDSFARHGVNNLPRLVASEITTLSVCDLRHNTRSVIGSPDAAISFADRTCFDRFFNAHPLVRYHSGTPGAGASRISDLPAGRIFRESALYNEYYRRIGIDHVVAVPLMVDRDFLVSFVLNRSGRDFSDGERAFLDLIREPMAALYRNLFARDRSRRGFSRLPITSRERDVLSWVAAGKTDREISEILGTSPRTVQKHLQHIYEKLGVETRTAAVMRAMECGARGSGIEPGKYS
jgi:DNA-binding CsgD family transcriptional regulator